MSNPETANFTDPAQFFGYFDIAEDKAAELTAHLRYQTTKKALESELITTRIYNCLLSGYSKYDDVKDETREWWANSAYNLGFAKKEEFDKIRNMGIKNVGKLNGWIKDYHILTLDDYLECPNAEALISKLEEGQKILSEKRPNWRRAMGLSAESNAEVFIDAIQESVPQTKHNSKTDAETAARVLSDEAAEKAFVQNYVQNRIKYTVAENERHDLAQPLDQLSTASAGPMRELYGKPNGQGGFFDVLADVPAAGRECFVTLGYNAKQITAIQQSVMSEKRVLNLDMRENFEKELYARIEEERVYEQSLADDTENFAAKTEQRIRLYQKKQFYAEP